LTVLFSGADMSELAQVMATPHRSDVLRESFFNNIDLTRAFYAHPKILVVALNGPVIGLPAALVSFADFIYALPHTFLRIPFSSLGLAAEGGASRALRERLGVSKAKEALMMSKRISCDELLACGFVNKIINPSPSARGADEALNGATFLEQVLNEVEKDLGSQLCDSSLLDIKAQFCRQESDSLDGAVVKEAYTAVERILAGVPQAQLKKSAKNRASKI